MYRFLYLLCSLALPVLGLAYAARAEEASEAAVYMVSYIEVSHRPKVRPWLSSDSTVRRAARRKTMCVLRCCNSMVDRTISCS